MSGPRPRANILEITPYVGGSKLASGWKLSSNENPLGCSDAAKRAIVDGSNNLAEYPDGSASKLRHAIAERYGIDADRIICGSGSDEIFQLLARAYLDPGDEILQSAHGFLIYKLAAQQAGANTIMAPERDLTTDVDAMLARVSDRTKIVFLANPNNPTGTYLPFDEVRRLHAGLPEHVILVLDGAYAEYVRRNDYSAGMELAGEAPNVLMTRTFSKIHGLAALRLGWAYGAASIIDALHRTRGPFNVNGIAQSAGIAALKDEAFQARSAELNATELQRVTAAIEARGYRCLPSVANFILIEFPDQDSQRAGDADSFLRGRGIVARNVDVYGLPNCLRLSIGVPAANDDVIAAFEAFSALAS